MIIIPNAQFERFRTGLDTQSLNEALATRGIATFDLCFNRMELISIAESLGRIHPHRDSDSAGLTVLEPATDASRSPLGFTRKGLFPHTDCSGESRPPDVVVFCSEEQAEFGGESLFVDVRALIMELRYDLRGFFSILTRPDAAMFSTPTGFTPMPILAQDCLGRFAFRFRLDNRIQFSDELAYRLPELIEIIRRHIISIPLCNGQGFVLNNGWWLHGRSSFSGYRRAVRILVDVDSANPAALHRGFIL